MLIEVDLSKVVFLSRPAELQYFSAMASFAAQLPCFYFLLDWNHLVHVVRIELHSRVFFIRELIPSPSHKTML